MIDPAQMKLGKRPGVVIDRRTFAARELIVPGVRVPDHSVLWPSRREFPMFRNDAIGDCGLASQGHRVIVQEHAVSQHEVAVSDDDVVAAYSAVSGYDPRTGANDNGVYLLDVLRYLRSTGMGLERDGTRHTIRAFAKVQHTDTAEVKKACYVFGGLYVGVALPRAAQHMTNWLDVGTGPEWQPYSWGGHAIYVLGFGPQGVSAITWGQRITISWPFWGAFVDEAYVVDGEDFWRRSGANGRGFDSARLDQLLATL